ncbi:hypothetical protein [Arenimonas sp. MALMAid1274]|uniref:hypothetical protein n=1 Tax=Arenimonas sp. MALMAid1274 TaxID=3411630 RepID=UPI003BA051FB
MKRLLMLLVLGLLVACTKPVPTDHRDYIGLWEGPGMRLDIQPDGDSRYEREREGRSTRISGPAHDFTTSGFKIGIGPLSARFKVSRAPAQVEGQWTMTVDGVALVRVRAYAEPGGGVRL